MKEIKLVSNYEEGCIVDKDLGAYKIINKGTDDIVIVKNYKYRCLKCPDVSVLSDQSQYKIVDVENRESYIVKPLDTLNSIAKSHNISVEELKKTNELKNDKLFIGQILKI